MTWTDRTSTSTTVTIAHRFRGPHTSGNGGYASGLVGAPLGRCATVTLKAPPPLDRRLELAVEGGLSRLLDAGTELARGEQATLDLDVPPAPALTEAEAASRHFAGYDHHGLPECFVCGTERKADEALCLHPGPVAGRELVATVWTPDAAYADWSGGIAAEYVWAALDCPGYFALRRPALVALLGRLTVDIAARPVPGVPLIVAGWPAGSDGRKHSAGTALYTADGEVLARAKAVWIELKAA